MKKYIVTIVMAMLAINTWILSYAYRNYNYQIAYKKVLETKPNACRVPDINIWKWRPFTLDQPCPVQKWVFHPLFKTCEPLCFEDKSILVELQDLPSTRRECENLCGDPCLVIFPNGTTLSEPGVCMGNNFCDIEPINSFWQWLLKIRDHRCESVLTSCCPKDYLRSSGIPE